MAVQAARAARVGAARVLGALLLAARASTALHNGVGLTPAMGFNTWNSFRCDINEERIRSVADALVSTGLAAAGYRYVVIDDCWMERREEGTGAIVPFASKFPSGMRALGEYIHSKGLLFGIYSNAGRHTCEGYPGSWEHEEVDARSYAAWGVDYLKYDFCDTQGLPGTPRQIYARMATALNRTGRPMLFSLCNWGVGEPHEWGAALGHSWRTGRDVFAAWDEEHVRALRLPSYLQSVLSAVDGILGRPAVARATQRGGYNDPDMLVVGLDDGMYAYGIVSAEAGCPEHVAGCRPGEYISRERWGKVGGLSRLEQRTHFEMWCFLAVPLMCAARRQPRGARAGGLAAAAAARRGRGRHERRRRARWRAAVGPALPPRLSDPRPSPTAPARPRGRRLGNDPRTLTKWHRELLTAPELLAISQDPLAAPAWRALRADAEATPRAKARGPQATTEIEIWARQLAGPGGPCAILVLNRGSNIARAVSVEFEAVVPEASARWRRTLELEEPCVDAHADPSACVGWAGSGECVRNPGFMEGACARSCAKCAPNLEPTVELASARVRDASAQEDAGVWAGVWTATNLEPHGARVVVLNWTEPPTRTLRAPGRLRAGAAAADAEVGSGDGKLGAAADAAAGQTAALAHGGAAGERSAGAGAAHLAGAQAHAGDEAGAAGGAPTTAAAGAARARRRASVGGSRGGLAAAVRAAARAQAGVAEPAAPRAGAELACGCTFELLASVLSLNTVLVLGLLTYAYRCGGRPQPRARVLPTLSPGGRVVSSAAAAGAGGGRHAPHQPHQRQLHDHAY